MNTPNPRFTREQLIERTFWRVATVIQHCREEGEGRGHTRFLDRPLVRDEYVLAGTSIRGGSVREHVVPLLWIYDECERMFVQGASVTEVAALIQANLKIVFISEEERRHLDSTLGLKTRMPDGWTFGDDPFARLTKGRIEFRPLTPP